ncbi:MAG TPA: DUF1592 domain-containing protein, partial [Tepidisphaeraceae bacterium]|nr:DUF1592 domain-containing protein [Tepidisphaeraceae bacterium]
GFPEDGVNLGLHASIERHRVPVVELPPDDVDHGFDNIGDVLSVSPVLMERYLAAAETIMAKAIALEPIKPNSRHTGAQFTEPAGRIPEVRYRPVFSGSIFTRFKLNDEGEYKLRTRALVGAPDAKWTAARPDDAKAAKGKDGEPIKAALIIDGKEVQAFDVTATDGRKAPTIEHTVTLPAGEHKFEVALKSGGTATKAMLVQFIEVVGPTDSRPAPHRKWLGNVDPKAPDKAVKTREILTKFASAAYRRPATKPEVDRLVQLAQSVEAQGQKWEAGIQFAFQAVLSSPKFIFRLELDDRPDSAEPQAIDEFALASRLSYFLWSSMPDAELTALAEKKQLTANLDAQVRRMLKDPKAEALVENFAMQWLQLRRLKTYAPDTKTYPAFDDRLRKSMLRETELFVEAVIKEDRSILDLIDADFTFLDRRLARHYGIADTNGNLVGQKPAKPVGTPLVQQGRGGFRDRGGESEFYRVSLQDRSRGGILTQASVLTVTSNPTRTSPVKRGKWVLEQILGTPPPPAPPNVPELEEAGEGHQLKGTLRQRMEQHRENPACASCHAKMDPMGFAFEQFDGVGGFRTTDGGSPIDPSGVLPDGKKFAGPAELKSMLKEKKELFARALAEKLLTYATGRGVEYYDKRAIDKIVAGMSKDGFKFSTLCVEVAKSDPFRMRRGLKQSE